jgi:hypothetical protein
VSDIYARLMPINILQTPEITAVYRQRDFQFAVQRLEMGGAHKENNQKQCQVYQDYQNRK